MKRKLNFDVRVSRRLIDTLNRTMKVYAEVVNKGVNEHIIEDYRLPNGLRKGCLQDIEKATKKRLSGELNYCSQMKISFCKRHPLTAYIYIPVIKKDGSFGIVQGTITSPNLDKEMRKSPYKGFRQEQVEVDFIRLYASFTNQFDAVSRNLIGKE